MREESMFHVDADIAQAYTLPAEFYREKPWWNWTKDQIFRKHWQWIGTTHKYATEANLYPGKLLPDFLDQPYLISRPAHGQLTAMSNVCTHRGAVLVTESKRQPLIRCPYHGRCFNLEGRFRSMPGFEGVADFPTEPDHLTEYALYDWRSLLFLKLQGENNFAATFQPMMEYMDFYPVERLKPWRSTSYHLNAHWALYCDNYLEGFHVPFVHPGLQARLNLDQYQTILFEHCSLQVGVAKPDEPHLYLPADHVLAGQPVFALYWWLFPNLMLNFYPWGLSLNLVVPITRHRTRVEFHYFLLEGVTEEMVEDSGIHQTEMEDEAVVELVHQGLQSGSYTRGRFSPQHERGVHHFHRMLSKLIHSSHEQ